MATALFPLISPVHRTFGRNEQPYYAKDVIISEENYKT